MPTRGKSLFRSLLFIFLITVAALFAIKLTTDPGHPSPPTTTTAPSTATAPSTTQAATTAPAKLPVSLLDIVRLDHPSYPTTQPLDLPADLPDAARIILNRPVHLDSMGRLWISHIDGKTVEEVLKKPLKSNTLIVRESVLAIHYSDYGNPTIFTRHPFSSDGKITVFQPRKDPVQMDAAGLDWDRAVRFGDSLILPTDSGCSSIQIESGKPISCLPLFALQYDQQVHTPAIVITTYDTILCWSPWDNDQKGSKGGIVKTPKQTYQLNASTGWFDHLLQLVPLGDGSILAIGKTENGMELKISSLEGNATAPSQDAASIEALARKLSDRDPVVREKTQRELEALGPSIYPILERIRESMPPESQVRIENMLGQRFAPMIAGLTPLPGQVKTASRFRDGGCAILLTGGGAYRESGEDRTLIPAWISIRPGQIIERLPDSLTAGFAIGQYQFQAFGSETLVIDPVLGAKRWMGARFYPLLGKSNRSFDQFIGIDGNHRWIFRSSTEMGKTLILDPSLPDITPRLPIWTIEAPEGAGWTNTDWPAVMKDKKRIFVLGEHAWQMLDDKTEKFVTAPPNLLPTVATDSAGNRLELSGKMIVGTYNKQSVLLKIPEKAGVIHSIFLNENKLFLAGTGAFHRAPLLEDQLNGELVIDGTFTKNVPSTPKRIWQDPFGRIVLADATTLWVAFPRGFIPNDLKTLIVKPIEEEEK